MRFKNPNKQPNIREELEALKKALIKKGAVTKTDIENEKEKL